MKFTITGRHFTISDDLKEHAEKKLMKLEKYFHRLIGIRVTMFMEKHLHVVDVDINADGSRFHANEKSEDMYNSIDLVVKSLEKQVSKHKDRITEHKKMPLGELMSMASPEESVKVYSDTVDAKPKDEIEAYLEMKMNKANFLMFKKHIHYSDNQSASEVSHAVLFSSGNNVKMVEIPIDMIKNKNSQPDNFLEFDVIVHNDSVSDPKIDFKKSSSTVVKPMTPKTALNEMVKSDHAFLTFFNTDTKLFNIIYKSGQAYQIISPVV